VIIPVRGELVVMDVPPHLAKSKHLASLTLRQVQDFASSPSRGEERAGPICVLKGLVDGFGPLSGLPP